MIKGVNKRIIEISDEGNQYFERAILFLRQEMDGKDQRFINERAKEYIMEMGQAPQRAGQTTMVKVRGKLTVGALKLGSAAAIGAVLTALLVRM